jgi:hypothetical protein
MDSLLVKQLGGGLDDPQPGFLAAWRDSFHGRLPVATCTYKYTYLIALGNPCEKRAFGNCTGVLLQYSVQFPALVDDFGTSIVPGGMAMRCTG